MCVSQRFQLCAHVCVHACVAAVRPGLTATPQKSVALHWVALGKQRDCTHCALIAQSLQEKVKQGPSSPDQTRAPAQSTHAPIAVEDKPIQL